MSTVSLSYSVIEGSVIKHYRKIKGEVAAVKQDDIVQTMFTVHVMVLFTKDKAYTAACYGHHGTALQLMLEGTTHATPIN